MPLSKKDNERVRPRLHWPTSGWNYDSNNKLFSATLCGLTLTFGVKSFLEVEQPVCKPPHFVDQLHDVVGICTRHVRAVRPRAGRSSESRSSPIGPNPTTLRPEERGKKWELGSRAIPSDRLFSPPLLCCSIPTAKIPAAASLNGSQCNFPGDLSDSKSFLTTDSWSCVHNAVNVWLNL